MILIPEIVQIKEMFRKYSLMVDCRKTLNNQWQIKLLSGNSDDFTNIIEQCYNGKVWHPKKKIVRDLYGYISDKNAGKEIRYNKFHKHL